MSFLPMHKKRLKKKMRELLKPEPGTKYVDLTIAFKSKKTNEAVSGPPVRYTFVD